MTPNKNIRRLILGLSLPLTLAACSGGGGGGGSDKPGAPPVVVAPAQEDKFGLGFGTAFRAPMDGEPRTVNDGDLVPVSLTEEPIAIQYP